MQSKMYKTELPAISRVSSKMLRKKSVPAGVIQKDILSERISFFLPSLQANQRFQKSGLLEQLSLAYLVL